MLVHFDPKLDIVLSCDASAYGIGAVLSHRMPDGLEKPVGFVSRTLSAAEKNYSQTEKKGLACVFGVKRFHSYLYGHSFMLITDHKPLLSLFNAQKAIPPQASARIQRWALTLAMYDYTLSFRSTKAHRNANTMSHLPLPNTPQTTPLSPEVVLLMDELEKSPVVAASILAWTDTDPLMSRVRQFIQSGWPDKVKDVKLKPFATRQSELLVQDGCVLWGNRVVVPKAGQAEVLIELHEAHPGEIRIKRLAWMFVWWPGIDKDIEEKVKSCSECQSNRSTTPVLPWQWPSRPWARLHLDFAGPFNGHMYLILIEHTASAPYHPATNGLAEQAVKIFKEGVKKLKKGTMQTKINGVLFRYRITPHSTTGASPAEMLMGRKLRSALDLLKPDVHLRVENKNARR